MMIPMEPRRPGCSVVEGKDITKEKVEALAAAADRCWQAIMDTDLQAFAHAYRDSFDAQTAMFPGMVRPVESVECSDESSSEVGSIQGVIDKWSRVPWYWHGKCREQVVVVTSPVLSRMPHRSASPIPRQFP